MKITSGAPAHLVHSQLVLLLLVQLAVEGLKLVLLPLPDLFLGGALLPVEARPVPPQGGGGAPRPGEGRCLCGSHRDHHTMPSSHHYLCINGILSCFNKVHLRT